VKSHTVANEGSAARDHLANERTFLAWLRTALGVVGLGLLLERFDGAAPEHAKAAGFLLIAFGCLSLLYAVDRYLRVARHLEGGSFPVAKAGPVLFGVGALIIVAGAALFGCGAPHDAPTARPAPETSEVVAEPPGSSPEVAVTPQACLLTDDCVDGVCEGEGCSNDAPGVCVARARPCTRDLAVYCGCDGQTFRGSGSCPGRRFAHRGACEPSAQ